MKKRCGRNRRAAALMLAGVLMLAGCSSSPKETVSTEEDGTTVTVDERGITKKVKSIPYDKLEYNEETLSLSSVDFYRKVSSSGHGFDPYLVLRFDVSSMSEDGRYFMMKDQGDLGIRTFETTVYITSVKNDIDFERMWLLDGWYDEKEIVCIYWKPEEYRYDFSDVNFTVKVQIEQDEKYMSESKSYHKDNSYTWTINSGYKDIIEIPIQDEDAIPEDVWPVIEREYKK